MGCDDNMSNTLTFSVSEQKAWWELYQLPFYFLIYNEIFNYYKKMKENFNKHPCTHPQLANYNAALCISMIISHSLAAKGDHSLYVSFSYFSFKFYHIYLYKQYV